MMTGAAATAGLAAWPALADPREVAPPKPEPVKLFAEGPLAGNLLAREFEVPQPPLVWPTGLRLKGYNKQQTTIEAYRGKTLVVSLWAEWCPPCLYEMPGFAYLESRTRSDTFQILPILTSSARFYRPDDAKPLLEKLHAKDMPILMEKRDRLVSTLGRDERSPTGGLPCNLLIDPQGRIRGRQIGGQRFEGPQGDKYSIWATKAALDFVKALAAGALV